jgi:hypothetical protein
MLRYYTTGESHGEALVAFISGLPAGVTVDQAFLDRELWRRQQGFGRGGRMKIERDHAHILSGVRHGKTIGSPISILLANNDWKKTLGSEWRQYESTFPLLAKSKIDQVSLECANSRVPLELIGLLQAGKGRNVSSLAADCQVTRRTIFRDLAILRQSGVPILFDEEFQAYHLDGSYLLPPTNFSASEALAVLVVCSEVGSHRQMPFLAPAHSAARSGTSRPTRCREPPTVAIRTFSTVMPSTGWPGRPAIEPVPVAPTAMMPVITTLRRRPGAGRR